jgi:hypothetical protein
MGFDCSPKRRGRFSSFPFAILVALTIVVAGTGVLLYGAVMLAKAVLASAIAGLAGLASAIAAMTALVFAIVLATAALLMAQTPPFLIPLSPVAGWLWNAASYLLREGYLG